MFGEEISDSRVLAIIGVMAFSTLCVMSSNTVTG